MNLYDVAGVQIAAIYSRYCQQNVLMIGVQKDKLRQRCNKSAVNVGRRNAWLIDDQRSSNTC